MHRPQAATERGRGIQRRVSAAQSAATPRNPEDETAASVSAGGVGEENEEDAKARKDLTRAT